MTPENKFKAVIKARYVLPFQEIDRSKLMLAGGKGANLSELPGIKGIRVPDGFCVTTEAYEAITANIPLKIVADYYKKFNKVVYIPGEGSVHEIFGKLMEEIEKRQ